MILYLQKIKEKELYNISVDYSANIIYGWKLTRERYNELPDEIKDEYGKQTDCYSYDGEYFIGIKLYNCYAGESYEIVTDNITLSSEDSARIRSAIPDIVEKYPNPSLYLYCKIS